jgi:response regulator RpfG family c-di-GMP phosphodiesterase
MSTKPKILCVDDEANILTAIQRSLRRQFDVHTANSGPEGLGVLQQEGPFHVVVSDMRMPVMTGAVFLKQVAKHFPDTVRILLTGFAELETVTVAVNEGHIFRFLTKPISGGDLTRALEDAVKQYELIQSEKVLLEQTLTGCIQALTEILSLANPAAFGRGTRIAHLATVLAAKMDVPSTWQVEVAAMLSQIGCITLPGDTAGKWYRGDELSNLEKAMVAKLPAMTQKVLGTIPRMEPVLEILLYSNKGFDGSGFPEDKRAGEDLPIGSRILKLAMRVEDLQSRGASAGMIQDDLHANIKEFDPEVYKVYIQNAARDNTKETVRGVTLQELRTGMVFTEDVKSKAGLMLVAKGQACTESLLERIQNYEATVGLKLPMWVENPDFLDPESEEARAMAEVAKPKEPDPEDMVIGEEGAAAFLEVD